MEWLTNLTGQDGSGAISLVLLIIGLALLLILVVWGIRKLVGAPERRAARNRIKRLSITDLAKVDDKRHLVLVRRDNVEHLILIGGATDIVVEQSIVRVQRKEQPRQPVQPGMQSKLTSAKDRETLKSENLHSKGSNPEETAGVSSAQIAATGVAAAGAAGATLGSLLEAEQPTEEKENMAQDTALEASDTQPSQADVNTLTVEEQSISLETIPETEPKPLPEQPNARHSKLDFVDMSDVTPSPLLEESDAIVRLDEATLEESLESVLASHEQTLPVEATPEPPVNAEEINSSETTPPEPGKKGVDDEMQRLLEELAGETSEKRSG